MRSYLLLLLFSLSFAFLFAQPDPPESPPKEVLVEFVPVFGPCDYPENLSNKEKNEQGQRCTQANVNDYILNSVSYPKKARRKGIQGVVYVQFDIDVDGSVRNVRILKGIPNGEGCDEEALRLVREFPTWKPGTQRGKAVKVQHVLPIRFKLK